MKKGWEVCALSSLFDIGSSKRVLKSEWKSEGVPFYRGREITKLATEGFVNNELFISEDHYTKLSEKYGVPRDGDIVITAIGTIGNSYIVRDSDKFYFKDASVLWMKRQENLFSEYVNYWLKAPLFFDQLDKGNGATVDTLNITKLKSLKIPIPSLSEQEEIVEVLDKAFAAIDQAKANIEQNIANAKELFQSKLNQIYSQKGEGWVETSLSDITTHISDGDHSAPPKSNNGIPFITISNIDKKSLEINFSSTFLVPEDYYASLKSHRKPEQDDVLYTVTGSFGIPVHISNSKAFCFQRHIGLLRPDSQTNGRFLFYLMQSPQVYEQANLGAKGTAQRTVSLTLLRQMKVPSVPFEQQPAIVKRLDHFSSLAAQLETGYQTKLASLDELKKSILQKAFAGELT